tara:strand:+ start:40 stop:705 length:666 start_codon:yes stop_codon:yes gene_type:complete
MKKIKILELFAGSRSLGSEAEKIGFEVFSIDWTAYDKINLVKDIGKLEKKDVPFTPGMVWASPDCSTYSIAACSTHRTNTKEPKSEYAKECDKMNKHWIGLIKEWIIINPDLIFFIENPRGMLRHMDFMQEFKRHTVWYCKYGDDRAKPTDIWTNSKTWKPRPMCKNYKYNKETGEIIDKHCHHESARRGARTGTQGRKNSFERSTIPKELCKEILNSLKP